MRRIPVMIREIVESQDRVRFDRAHFQGFGDFALLFEVVYYVLSREYNVHMDIQQSINMTLLERFAAEGIEFAYPTQTVFVSGVTQ
jgi:small-conductance mechanosensitive channel